MPAVDLVPLTSLSAPLSYSIPLALMVAESCRFQFVVQFVHEFREQ